MVFDGVELYVKMIVDKGCGYLFVDDNKICMEGLVIGVLLIDFIYILIECVNYMVENIWVG